MQLVPGSPARFYLGALRAALKCRCCIFERDRKAFEFIGDLAGIDFGRWRFYTPPRMPEPPLIARLPMAHLCGEHREIAVRTVLDFPIPLESRVSKLTHAAPVFPERAR